MWGGTATFQLLVLSKLTPFVSHVSVVFYKYTIIFQHWKFTAVWSIADDVQQH